MKLTREQVIETYPSAIGGVLKGDFLMIFEYNSSTDDFTLYDYFRLDHELYELDRTTTITCFNGVHETLHKDFKTQIRALTYNLNYEFELVDFKKLEIDMKNP